MEAAQSAANPNPNGNNTNSILSSTPVWPTIDGPLGLTEDESLTYARRFYKFGFALLPWLWAVSCFYFWPVLFNSRSFPRIRPYVVRSAVGFTVFTALLLSWALTFSIGGEQLFGPVWDKLVTYNVADRLGLTATYIAISISTIQSMLKYLFPMVNEGKFMVRLLSYIYLLEKSHDHGSVLEFSIQFSRSMIRKAEYRGGLSTGEFEDAIMGM